MKELFSMPAMPSPSPGALARPPRPVATYVIIAACTAVFILQNLAGGSENPNVLLDFGASYGPYLREGQYWRLVMPMFLHIGWWHLLMNMYALFLLGPLLEQMYGYGRYLFIYVGAGISSSLLSMLRSHSVAAGASGAIFGLAGAILIAGYLHREALPVRIGWAFRRGRLGLSLLVFIVVNLVFGYAVPNIDNWGHLGGLAGGALLAFLIPPPRVSEGAGLPPTGEQRPSQAIVVVPVAAVALAMAAAANHYRVGHQVTRLLEDGSRLEAAHQTSQAIDCYQRAERLDPHDDRPHRELGGLYLEQHRFSDAISEFNQALRISPDSPEDKLGLAAAYQESGDLTKAQQLFEAVLGKDPPNAEGQEALADVCAAQKSYAQAIAHYQKALRLDPRMAEAHNNLAWLYATAEDAKFRNPSQALDHARQAVQLSGGRQPDFIDTLAEALYVNRQYADAVKVEERALKLQPDNQELQQHMARYRKAAGV
jgi:rhomboid protease GluP